MNPHLIAGLEGFFIFADLHAFRFQRYFFFLFLFACGQQHAPGDLPGKATFLIIRDFHQIKGQGAGTALIRGNENVLSATTAQGCFSMCGRIDGICKSIGPIRLNWVALGDIIHFCTDPQTSLRGWIACILP